MRRCILLAAGGLTALTIWAAAAWACLPFPLVSIEPSGSGPAATEITVNGIDFGSGPTEVRWNGLNGPQLGTGEGPEFSTQVKVPDVPAGLYTVVVVVRGGDGEVVRKAAAPFQVTGPGSEGTQPAGESFERDGDDDESLPLAQIAGFGLSGLGLAALCGILGGWIFSRRMSRKSTESHESLALPERT